MASTIASNRFDFDRQTSSSYDSSSSHGIGNGYSIKQDKKSSPAPMIVRNGHDGRDNFSSSSDESSIRSIHQQPLLSFVDRSNPSLHWLNLQFHDANRTSIKKPDQLEAELSEPPTPVDQRVFDRVAGSMLGLAIGDALGAHVEFRPHDYLIEHPVTDLTAGGTWGLEKGQFTDDTSMALCLASSLIVLQDFSLYDQLLRYKWWYRFGYMSSTGQCFDIGAATSQSLEEFERRQTEFAKHHNLSLQAMDHLTDRHLLEEFNVYCSEEGTSGNGALMRLAPVPLFFYHDPSTAVDYAGESARVTHGDQKAVDACRYYAALIVAALQNYTKDQLLDDRFYEKHSRWFGENELHAEILKISQGSYKKPAGYDDGIRGKGYVVPALEAALWAFWSTDSFEKGALAAVNLGDDTDTTAAIYGQLAGAFYGLRALPSHWSDKIYARKFLLTLSEWLVYFGERHFDKQKPRIPTPEYSSPVVTTMATATPVFIKQTPSRSVNNTRRHRYDAVQRWPLEEVLDWLQSFGDRYAPYIRVLEENQIDGFHLCHLVDETFLHSLLATNDSKDHASILRRIDWLKADVSEEFYRQFYGNEYNICPELLKTGKGVKDTIQLSIDERKERAMMYRDIEKQLPSSFTIDDIAFIHHEDRYRIFLQRILSIEQRESSKNQGSIRKQGDHDEERMMLGRLKKLTGQVLSHRPHSVRIVRGWYVCSRQHMSQIERSGRLSEQTIKLKSSARYAAVENLSENACLVMCYLILHDLYPVILQRGSPNRYRFYTGGLPSPSTFPGKERTSLRFSLSVDEVEDGMYDEYVTSNPDDILPQVFVTLRSP